LSKLCEKVFGLTGIHHELEEAEAKGDEKKCLRLAEEMLFMQFRFNLGGMRNLSDQAWYDRIEIASMENDHGFFKRLGRLLNEDPKELPYEKNIPEFYLAFNWWSWEGQEVGLCEFSDDALLQLIELKFGDENGTEHSFEFDGVKKMRQRLGLEKGTIRYHSFIQDGDRIIACE